MIYLFKINCLGRFQLIMKLKIFSFMPNDEHKNYQQSSRFTPHSDIFKFSTLIAKYHKNGSLLSCCHSREIGTGKKEIKKNHVKNKIPNNYQLFLNEECESEEFSTKQTRA